MRDIKFRGKRKDNGEWVHGALMVADCLNKGKAYICESNTGTSYDYASNTFMFGDWVEVIPETVGQYTGFKDKNDKEIYEGDIVRYNGTLRSEVRFNDEDAGFKYYSRLGKHHPSKDYCSKYIEVIGNIYDNPELLEDKP